MLDCRGIWHTAGSPNSEYLGCGSNPRWAHCFNSLKALGKLLAQAAYPLNPGLNGNLAKDSFYSVALGIIVLAAIGVYAPQRVEM